MAAGLSEKEMHLTIRVPRSPSPESVGTGRTTYFVGLDADTS
eukprot:gene13784-45946_t